MRGARLLHWACWTAAAMAETQLTFDNSQRTLGIRVRETILTPGNGGAPQPPPRPCIHSQYMTLQHARQACTLMACDAVVWCWLLHALLDPPATAASSVCVLVVGAPALPRLGYPSGATSAPCAPCVGSSGRIAAQVSWEISASRCRGSSTRAQVPALERPITNRN